jgi:hypothetical protein
LTSVWRSEVRSYYRERPTFLVPDGFVSSFVESGQTVTFKAHEHDMVQIHQMEMTAPPFRYLIETGKHPQALLLAV